MNDLESIDIFRSRLIEAASWHVATALVRRHPELRIVQTHPGGGQYDCLAIYRRGTDPFEGPHLDLNRLGSAHIWTPGHADPRTWDNFWLEYLAAPDPYPLICDLETQLDMTAPEHTPSTTAEVLVYRIIAEALGAQCWGRRPYSCHNAYLDTSGYGAGLDEVVFDVFPTASERRRCVETDDLYGVPEYRFWELAQADQPVALLEVSGHAFRADGTTLELMAQYQSAGRRLWPVLDAVIGSDLAVRTRPHPSLLQRQGLGKPHLDLGIDLDDELLADASDAENGTASMIDHECSGLPVMGDVVRLGWKPIGRSQTLGVQPTRVSRNAWDARASQGLRAISLAQP